jgi:hypothetical protein
MNTGIHELITVSGFNYEFKGIRVNNYTDYTFTKLGANNE